MFKRIISFAMFVSHESAQWENECIPPPVLSIAWVIIAQWENEYISPSVHSHCLGHDSWVGEWMNLTVCPLYGPGHDSSVGEWIYLTVCSLHCLGHDSSVGENGCIFQSVLSAVRVQFAAMTEYFKGFFPGWSHSVNSSWASVAENNSIFATGGARLKPSATWCHARVLVKRGGADGRKAIRP